MTSTATRIRLIQLNIADAKRGISKAVDRAGLLARIAAWQEELAGLQANS